MQQFNNRTFRTSSYSRDNGDCICNWDAEIDILCGIYQELCCRDLSNAIFRFQKVLAMLGPWILQISLSKRERIDDLDESKIYKLFDIASTTENNLSCWYRRLND
mgnify:CR=1 FL=1